MISGPTSASPGNFLEMQILGLHHRPAGSAALKVAPATCHLTNPSFSALRTTYVAFLRVGIQPPYQELDFPLIGNTMIFKLCLVESWGF